ncbi:hypothetical protein [Marseilla massiliensis]|jgi:hypothetical protein|uniref:Uncharacterized protein n=1 Tax=Marseilla massiliensis TaxID=1841864 RepID=A0A938WSG1_9BACT|nr:hypothetical protein [Marseilla massiliensis]MBM6673334.1 hypothetical protein [Marseilla massiliensis]CCY64338.1 putative uncharacterized protein [Prevotella sp. CAG:1124]
MKSYKNLIMAVAVMIICGWTINASAKLKCVPKLYAFGFAASFNDSTVYFTDIQEIDSAWINDKNDFLVSRDNYSYQLKNYFTSLGLEHRTCVISFALKRKDIEKKYQKMKNKYVKAGNYDIKSVSTNDFHFTAIKPDNYEIEAAQ